MPEFKDLTNKNFGEWLVLYRDEDHVTPKGFKFTAWRCRCSCGTERTVLANALLSGRSTSCGCVHNAKQRNVARNNFTTHGESKSRLYKIWLGMKKRCYNQNSTNYKNYGNRGISVCDEWLEDYPKFKDWSLSHGYSDELTIDRINVNLGYCPENCRWVDLIAQANNRRNSRFYTIDGISKTIRGWADEYGIHNRRLYEHIHKGEDIAEAIKYLTNHCSA